MFGIGESELALILLFAFLIFGPDKLPGMGRTIGRALRQFRNAQEGFTQVVQTEIVDPATEAMSDAPKKPNRKRSEEEDADIEGSGSPKFSDCYSRGLCTACTIHFDRCLYRCLYRDGLCLRMAFHYCRHHQLR